MNITTITSSPAPPPTDMSPDRRSGTDAATIGAAFYDAFLAGDIATASGLLAPDAVLHVPGTNPVAGDHVGLDAILEFVLTTQSILGTGREALRLVDLAGGATHATAICEVTGERPGRPVMHNRTVHVLRVDGDRIAEVWFHNWDQPSVDAFWS